MAKKKYKGTFLPADVLRRLDLTWVEKIILADIMQFVDKGCYINNKTFADRLGVTRRYVKKIIKQLKEKGVIMNIGRDEYHRFLVPGREQSLPLFDTPNSDKTPPFEHGPKGELQDTPYKAQNAPQKVNYRTPGGCTTGHRGGELQDTGGVNCRTPVVTIKKHNKGTIRNNSQASRLALLLLDLIIERNPKHKKPNLRKWEIHIDRLIRIDKRKPEIIEQVIRWCQSDDFWQDNILSTEKLRKQFDQLFLKMNKGCNDGRKRKPTNPDRDYHHEPTNGVIVIDNE